MKKSSPKVYLNQYNENNKLIAYNKIREHFFDIVIGWFVDQRVSSRLYTYMKHNVNEIQLKKFV